MASADIPGWMPLLFSGGLIGLATFFVKQITDQKDASITSLKDQVSSQDKQISSLERLQQKEIQNIKSSCESRLSTLQRENERLKDELQEVANFQNLLEINLTDLRKQGITGETNPNIREILKSLQLLKNYATTEADHRAAARWIRIRKDSWLNEIVDYVSDKHPEELKDKRDKFTHDISECLTWFYDSTFYNVPHQFSDYLSKPSVDSIFPYRSSFKYLKQKDDVGELNSAETEFFYQYLDILIQFLQDQPIS